MKDCCCCPSPSPSKKQPEFNDFLPPISYKFSRDEEINKGELSLFGDVEYNKNTKELTLKTSNGLVWDPETKTLTLLKLHDN